MTKNDAFESVKRSLQLFSKFPRGWHYFEGIPFEKSLIASTLSLGEQAAKLELEIDVFPGTNGEMLLTVYGDRYNLDFTLEPDGTVSLCIDGLTLQDATVKLAELQPDYDYEIPLGETKLAALREADSLRDIMATKPDEMATKPDEMAT